MNVYLEISKFLVITDLCQRIGSMSLNSLHAECLLIIPAINTSLYLANYVYSQYHSCWYPCNFSRQDISSHNVDLVPLAECQKINLSLLTQQCVFNIFMKGCQDWPPSIKHNLWEAINFGLGTKYVKYECFCHSTIWKNLVIDLVWLHVFVLFGYWCIQYHVIMYFPVLCVGSFDKGSSAN